MEPYHRYHYRFNYLKLSLWSQEIRDCLLEVLVHKIYLEEFEYYLNRLKNTFENLSNFY